MYDAIIIGRGPAGISCSIYTSRAGLKTLVVGKDDSALKKAEKIQNYYGFSNPISGKFLLEEGEKQARALGVEIIEDEVIDIDKEGFFTITAARGKYAGKAVLLAAGRPRKAPKIENLSGFEGRGVSYCPTCDGFFFKGLNVGVLGHKDYAVHEAMELEAYTKKITIFTDGYEPDVSEKFAQEAKRFRIIKEPVMRLEGDDFLRAVVLAGGSEEKIDGLFIAYGTASSLNFAKKLGITLKDDSVVVDEKQSTSVAGLFAAGDCTGGLMQIAVAVGQGAVAGKNIIEYVRGV